MSLNSGRNFQNVYTRVISWIVLSVDSQDIKKKKFLHLFERNHPIPKKIRDQRKISIMIKLHTSTQSFVILWISRLSYFLRKFLIAKQSCYSFNCTVDLSNLNEREILLKGPVSSSGIISKTIDVKDWTSLERDAGQPFKPNLNQHLSRQHVLCLHHCQIAKLFASDADNVYARISSSRRINNNGTSPFAWWIEEGPFTGTSRNEVAIHSCLLVRFFSRNICAHLFVCVCVCVCVRFPSIYCDLFQSTVHWRFSRISRLF